MSAFESSEDVRSYFRDQVARALACLGVDAVAPTETYLAELLAGFARPEGAALWASPIPDLARAADEASGPIRLLVMRRLGDVSLFASGFLPASVDRAGLSERHVVRLGGRAYLMLGEAAQEGGESTSAALFTDLAGRFEAFVRVLDEVREQTALCTEGPIVRLFERWCRTGSPAIARRLHEQGATPGATPDERLH